MIAAACDVGTAPAQQPRPAIVVADLLRIEPAVEVALPIQVAPPNAAPRGSFVRLRGLPATAALSNGHSIAPGAWSIPVADLPRLKILLPQQATGRSEVSITLVSAEGAVLAEAEATLVVAAPPGALTAAANAAPLPRASPVPPPRPGADAQPVPPAPQLAPEARQRALRLIKKGDEQLADGGIAQARLLYERAAEAGLALGAMAMAATYDAVELERMGARGIVANHDVARRWYERARQLGAVEAEDRLRRLSAR